jgi:aspartate/methionine/tyrosine aminotransferase
MESAFHVLEAARQLEAQGRQIVHLEIGEPDFDTPAHIVAAARCALDRGETHYVPAPGLAELREAVASFLAERRRLNASPSQVVVTPGAKPILFYTIMALCQQGDEVLYPDPGFPMYESIAAFAGATPVPVPLRATNEFVIDPEELASLVTPRSRLLILNFPHNPCGSAASRADLERIAEIALENDLLVLSDEVYWATSYEHPHASIMDVPGMPERTVLLDGWSKTFAMTGWRLGFGVLPSPLVEPVTRLIINSVSCTAAFAQRAAIAALTGPWQPVDDMVAEFRARRDLIVAGLNALDGISCSTPGGAFYVFPSVSALGLSAEEAQEQLLARAGVACLAGTSFGRGGEGHLRLSYATSRANIQQALDAITANLRHLA